MKKTTFRKTDLSWIVDYDYNRSGCTCGAEDGICRCTTIEEAWINHVNTHTVVDELFTRHGRSISKIDKYCFDRICHTMKIYDKDFYTVETSFGYYGEEVTGVSFADENKIVEAYNELLALNTAIEKIQYCLKLEYGYLIDCVRDASSADIIAVPTHLILTPQMEYFKKVDKEVIEEYKNRDLPVAVCICDQDRYRLIDGYHRFAANQDRETVDIIIIGRE